MRSRATYRLILLTLAVFAGCGGGSSSTTSTKAVLTPAPSGKVVTIPGPVEASPAPTVRAPAAQIAQRCPVGAATMGCAQQAIPNLTRGPALAIPPVPLFPDVSVYQGAVNWPLVAGWQRAHGWHPMAIWKMGEYRIDVQARRNALLTARLGFYRSGYWFVRNTGCAHEAAQMIAEGRAEGLRVLVEDDEVPEAAGYAACLTPRLLAAGFAVVEYAGPGTNPDGARNPGVRYLWVAAYGPSHVPCLFVCSVGDLAGRQTIVAWQLTDGVFGFVTTIPGIGRDDVSADYGLSRVLAGGGQVAPAKPKGPVQLRVLLNASFPSPWGRLNERHVAAQFVGAYAHRARYRRYLRGVLRARLNFLAARIAHLAVARHEGWSGARRGSRFQFLINDAREAGKA